MKTFISLAFLLTGDAAAFQKCQSCHAIEAEEGSNPAGPNLAGVMGRRAASLPDFTYSPALQAKGRDGLIWDEKTLDAFLQAPETYVPGTYMGFLGLLDAKEREAVIRYLSESD